MTGENILIIDDDQVLVVGLTARLKANGYGIKLVRKGGFEPPRLSAPPPQDGVSASSTTSARQELLYYQ
jgi:hypothetical protein